MGQLPATFYATTEGIEVTNRSITFSESVEKQCRLSLARHIDAELRASAKDHFLGVGVTFAVSNYPGGLLIGGQQYESGAVVRIVATPLDGKTKLTYMAGFDGEVWRSCPLTVYQVKPKKKKNK